MPQGFKNNFIRIWVSVGMFIFSEKVFKAFLLAVSKFPVSKKSKTDGKTFWTISARFKNNGQSARDCLYETCLLESWM